MGEGIRGFKTVQREELKALLAALDHVKDFSVAVDGGAHVGGWTDVMAGAFDHVHAFEPAPDTFRRLQENMAGRSNVRLYQLALMDKRQTMEIALKANSPARQVYPKDGGDVLGIGLDELALPSCGLIKLDLEGCEYFALRGALRTIKQHKPFLVIEMSGLWKRFELKMHQITDWLQQRDYRKVFEMGVNVGYASR